MSVAVPSAGAPSLALLVAEPLRALFEYVRMRCMAQARNAAGDGHPVVVFPGLATNHLPVRPLVAFCSGLGYHALDWGRGFNTGPQGAVDDWLDELGADVGRIVRKRARRATLIGWSLGGLYAREIAKRRPADVRQVITIGSPFAGGPGDTHAGWLYRLVNGERAHLPRALAVRLRTAPPVPTTSIYSRSDGVVAWRACRSARAEHVENIEVEGSHLGLAWNPRVLTVIADRLGQPEGRWQRFCETLRPQRGVGRRRHRSRKG
jgi:pimeloyl-ACP methyl ester carboxylesterase